MTCRAGGMGWPRQATDLGQGRPRRDPPATANEAATEDQETAQSQVDGPEEQAS